MLFSIDGVIETNICLLPMVSECSGMMLRLNNQYQSNILPKSGGWLDQPNFYIESMEIINSHRSKILSEKQRGH